MTLRTRVIALVVGVAALSTLLAAWLVTRTAEQALREQQRTTVETSAAIYQTLADYGTLHSSWADVQPEVDRLSRRYDVRVALADRDAVLADSNPDEPLPGDGALLDPLVPRVSFAGESENFSITLGEAAPMARPGQQRRCLIEHGLTPVVRGGALTVRESGQQAEAVFSECELVSARARTAPPVRLLLGTPHGLWGPFGIAWQRSLLLALGILLVAGLIGWWLGRRLTSPLTDLAGAAQRLAHGDLTQRTPHTGSDEVGRVGEAFNQMADSLERSAAQRSRLVSDVAHELSNPLVTIGGTIEALQDGIHSPTPEVLDSLHDEVAHLSALVRDLGDLSRAEAGALVLELAPINVAAVAESVVAAARLPGGDVEMSVQGVGTAYADQRRVRQILVNLVGNAVRHTEPGGAVRVVVSTTATTDAVVVEVEDTGEGIAAADLPHVFDRFWRADSARSRNASSGTGLGLAICRELAQAQGGDLEAESELGAGTTFRLRLPAPPQTFS